MSEVVERGRAVLWVRSDGTFLRFRRHINTDAVLQDILPQARIRILIIIVIKVMVILYFNLKYKASDENLPHLLLLQLHSKDVPSHF